MRNQATWVAMALFAFAQMVSAGQIKKDVACTANGHGPYDESWLSCSILGAEQARADCVIAKADRSVKVEGRRQSDLRTTSCFAKYSEATSDCVSHCLPYVRRPQRD